MKTLTSMNVWKNGLLVAKVVRRFNVPRSQWELSYRTENPVSLPLHWCAKIGQVRALIAKKIPGSTVTYHYSRDVVRVAA